MHYKHITYPKNDFQYALQKVTCFCRKWPSKQNIFIWLSQCRCNIKNL